MDNVPTLRIRKIGDTEANPDGNYVLYWMISFRRGHYNFSLQRAVQWAKELNKPLVILEALRCDYPWASDRLHQFVIEGMSDNAQHFAKKNVLYYPYPIRSLTRQGEVQVVGGMLLQRSSRFWMN